LLGYHHPRYQALLTGILKDELRCVVATHTEDGVCGVLPYRIGQSRYGAVLNALPFFGCGGLVAIKPHSAATVETALLTTFKQRTLAPDILSAAFYTPFNTNPSPWLPLLKPDQVTVKFTQYLPHDAMQSWPKKRVADLRRAAARGFVVRPATRADADRIADIHSQNCRDAAIPAKPRAFIAETLALCDELGAQSPMRWLAAMHDGQVVAALLYGLGPETGSYILPCAEAAERTHQPNVLLMDVAIRQGLQNGMRHWNFESSPAWNDPVFKFKERWGAVTAPFAVLSFYGAGGHRPSYDAITAARTDLPFYFIAPVGQVGGAWPPQVPLPPDFGPLAPYIS
jgi:hypothetical protein